MKLKYYLRGLGTGIAVTALIIGISAFVSRKEVMTDEEVIARAKELGMVERTVLSEMVTETEENDEESEPEGQTPEESEAEVEEKSETVPEENVAEEPGDELEADEPEAESELTESEVSEPEITEPETIESETTEPESEEAKFGMPDEAGTIQFTIVRGDSSDSVSRRLEEAGLVDSAADYDRYLCRNGYDKRIQTGNYEIPANATQEEIAIMITSR